jgi:hypothetical protein
MNVSAIALLLVTGDYVFVFNTVTARVRRVPVKKGYNLDLLDERSREQNSWF